MESHVSTTTLFTTCLMIGYVQSAITNIPDTTTKDSLSLRTCDKSQTECQTTFDPDQCYHYKNWVINTMEVRDCARVCRQDLETYNRYECEKESYCAGFIPTNIYCDELTTRSMILPYSTTTSIPTTSVRTSTTTAGTNTTIATTSKLPPAIVAAYTTTTPSNSASTIHGRDWKLLSLYQLILLFYSMKGYLQTWSI